MKMSEALENLRNLRPRSEPSRVLCLMEKSKQYWSVYTLHTLLHWSIR